MVNTDIARSPIPILTYHSIDDSGSVVSLAPKLFQEQMQFLSESGFKVVSVGELLARVGEQEPLPAKTAAITFDDGYENMYTEAFPVLQKYGFKATVFLIADYCGKHSDWPGNSPSLASRPLLSWGQVKEMHRDGIDFGSHTLTHPDLTRLTRQQASYEIVSAKNKIENEVGDSVTVFAYPYGKHNSEVKQIVQEHFRGACSTDLGEFDAGSDLHLLKRIDMYYLKHPGLFKRLSTTTLARYLRLRQSLRSFKSYF